VNYSTEFESIRNEVPAQEWQTRLDLAACYRLVDAYGMTDLIYNHITARIPGTEHGRECARAHRAPVPTRRARRPYGVLEWPAMLRLLTAEQKNSGYPPYWH
jgi:hypothetical protein